MFAIIIDWDRILLANIKMNVHIVRMIMQKYEIGVTVTVRKWLEVKQLVSTLIPDRVDVPRSSFGYIFFIFWVFSI